MSNTPEKLVGETLKAQLPKDIRIDFKNLQRASIEFLSNMQNILNSSKDTNQHINLLQGITIDKNEDNGEISVLGEAHRSTDKESVSTKIEREVIAYSNIIDKWEKRMILLCHISYSDPENPLQQIGDFTIMDLQSQLNNQIFRIEQTKIQKSESSTFFSKALTDFLNTRAKKKGFKDVYIATVRRWEDYREQIGVTTKTSSYYFTEKKRMLTRKKFANRGPIAEGYAQAVLQNDEKAAQNNPNADNINKIKEQQGQAFEDAVHYLIAAHAQKDNVSGLAQGDVNKKINLIEFFEKNPDYSIYQNLSLQFAVKQYNASVASENPYIKFALYISTIDENTWLKDLQKHGNFSSLIEKQIKKIKLKEKVKNTCLTEFADELKNIKIV